MIKLFRADFVISLPTFIIAECVLIYLDPDSSRGIVAWASKKFSTAVFFLYEQVSRLYTFLNFVTICFCFLFMVSVFSMVFWLLWLVMLYFPMVVILHFTLFF